MSETKDTCLIAAIRRANDEEAGAQAYLADKLIDEDVDVPRIAGQVGGEVRCDRCFAIFSILPGGVYLEQQGLECDEADGSNGKPHEYQVSIRVSA